METKKWYQSRTIWTGFVLQVLGAVLAFSETIPDETVAGYVALGAGVLMQIMRAVTNTSVTK